MVQEVAKKHDVDRLIVNETWLIGRPKYSGTVMQILALVSFQVKVMVRDGEIKKQDQGITGYRHTRLPWDLAADTIKFHLFVNITAKMGKCRLGPELDDCTMNQLEKSGDNQEFGS